MTFWVTTGVVIIVGALGGMINAFLSDSGSFKPGSERVGGRKIWKPGVSINMVFGAAAAFISWGLFGSFPPTLHHFWPSLTLATFVGAFLVGIVGSKVVTSEVEKRILSAAASTAAEADANPHLAANIATASSPTEALRAAAAAPRPQQ